MRRRYVTRASADDAWRGDWDAGDPHRTAITVVEPHHEQPQDTGLLDQYGNELYRLPDVNRPVGFLSRWSEDDGEA
jgi:hypothetical protein